MVNFIIYIFLPCITKDRKVVLGEAFHKLTSRYFSALQKFCLFEKAETGPVPRQRYGQSGDSTATAVGRPKGVVVRVSSRGRLVNAIYRMGETTSQE
jgi:hypothetical protein